MSAARLTNALIRSVKAKGRDPFMTYGDFGREFGLSDKYPHWANRRTLDPAAVMLKNDPQIRIDLTFLIRNKKRGFPSVIDGMPYKHGDKAQQQRVRDVADQIIAKFGIRHRNPY